MKQIFGVIVFILLQLFCGIEGQTSGCDSLLSWQCGNGECIGIAERCNGIKDCSDGTDETVVECISFQCPDTQFRCLYGACVNKTAECNGEMDCVDNSDELTEKCIPNIDKIQRGNCSIDQFQCNSGECIPVELACNGSPDCSDRTDETVEHCAPQCCPPFGFRCGYGGCIDERGRCDGIVDCYDESDENYLLCGYPKSGRPPPPTEAPTTPKPSIVRPPGDIVFPGYEGYREPDSCVVEQIPRNGWIEYSGSERKISYGESVPKSTVVKYGCLDNHLVDGDSYNFCFNGEWKSPIPDCQPFCSTQVISGVSIQATNCFLNDDVVRCNEPARPGTIAHIDCKTRYELPGVRQQVLSCSDNGQWIPQPEVCTPICGEEAPAGTPYIVGGLEANITKVPWHAGLYKRHGDNYNLQCGATIVNARVLISAMHCFWDRNEEKPYDVSFFRVAVGKASIDYLQTEDLKAQFFDVERIFYDNGYNDLSGNFNADIVLVILKTTIEFRAHIAPICIPYGLTYADIIVPSDWIGRVAGWGLTSSSGQPSPILKIIELPVVDRPKCIADSPEDFIPQITPDKFCAGLLGSGVGVCQGDSGGGLVFPQKVKGRDKFFLRGIVSTGPSKQGSCDSDKYTTFTNILYHEKLIALYEPRYRPR